MTIPTAITKPVWLGALVCAGLLACAPKPQASDQPAPPLPAYFDCIREHGVLISAHRGAPDIGYPENAIASFDNAVAAGITFLEVDVRATRDGALVLFHDATLERTSDGRGRLVDKTLKDLDDITLRDIRGRKTGDRIPTLAEALAWAKGRAVLSLDIKDTADPADVIAAVRAADAHDAVVLIAYSEDDTARYQALAPEIMVSAYVNEMAALDRIKTEGLDTRYLLTYTGTKAPNAELNAALRAGGMEPIFGSTGGRESWDARITAPGSTMSYRDIVETGVVIIATDKPFDAAAALSEDEAANAACSLKGIAP